MSVEKEKFPAPSYTENVLADCFEDAKNYFLEALIDVDHAHAIMLADLAAEVDHPERIAGGEMVCRMMVIENVISNGAHLS